ncbi:hypothetical protein Y032_0029g1908 [Ancylostoma ceylanicum]|uniref:Uncharacterized protein n=1 Tax=Ancylostoma ceylanicum TaxID=53326 RepID=A0A016UTN5_9BILA|nr:hypothetical protein Y032_0029g1908 [Ancylostoma ceylanicum]
MCDGTLFSTLTAPKPTIWINLSTVGTDGGDPSKASKSTRFDRAARAGIPSRSTKYGVFLTVSWFSYQITSGVGRMARFLG